MTGQILAGPDPSEAASAGLLMLWLTGASGLSALAVA
jgi:hypothetical protein